MKRMICAVLAVMLLAFCCAGCAADETELENGAVRAENASPYSGVYLEYGDRELVEGLYAIRFTNTGEKTISDAQFIFNDGQQELVFRLEMLRKGQSVLVAENNQIPATDAKLKYVDGYINYLDETVLERSDSVDVELQTDGQLYIRNTTGEDLPLVRVFFRPTDENGALLGGPCSSVIADGIAAGGTAVVADSGWDASCAIVTVLVINE